MSNLTASTRLLDAELPDPRFVDDAYLHWLYEDNPWGPAYQGDIDEGGERVAHYALIPQEYRDAAGPVPAAFSLNAVVRSGTQRRGYFTKIGLELYARAAADGRRLVVGVSNARSVGAVVKYMGWRLMGPLPVRAMVPVPRRGRAVVHHAVDDVFLAGDVFARVAADLDAAPALHLTNRWTTEHLRWRLARPHTRYVLHVADDVVAVTTRATQRGVPVTVVLKLFPRGGRAGALTAGPVVSAACALHRTPLAVYAGFNAHVRFRGVRTPRRLQPSPLYLIIRALTPDVDQGGLVVETFELLDMDGY